MLRTFAVYVLFALLASALYVDNRDHAFFLDSGHVLVDNVAVRDLGNIPRYFTDPGTFSPLRSNIDWRPLLQVTYALNYAVSGYEMWSYHLVQIQLHALVALLLWLLFGRVLRATSPRVAEQARGAPLLAALIFLLHPTSVGVVCYLSARSSMLSGAFSLAAILAYMAGTKDADSSGCRWLAALLLACGLLTKVEAVATLAPFFLWEVWRRKTTGCEDFWPCLRAALDRRTLRRLAPSLVVVAVYFWARAHVMAPFEFGDSRLPSGVSRAQYFFTQVAVWWRYTRQWFYPLGLCADDSAYPVVQAFWTPRFLLAAGGWVAAAAVLLSRWRTHPGLTYLAVTGLALLSPTSSIMPLAEMHNELRPYLPVAVLSGVWVLPAVAAARGLPRRWQLAVGLGFLAWFGGVLSATEARRMVFTTHENYWRAILDEAPSARAHNNYALTLRGAGLHEQARAHFEDAVRLAPRWHVAHINMSLEHERAGDFDKARASIDQAVRWDRFSHTARLWRADLLKRRQEWDECWADVQEARKLSLYTTRVHSIGAICGAWAGSVEAALADARALLVEDPAGGPSQTVQALNAFFQPERAADGVRYLRGLEDLLGDTWWYHYNLGTLLGRVGDEAGSKAAFAESGRLKALGKG